MASQPIEARDYFLACYAVSLVQGETILGTPIRYTTLKLYLSAAYDLFEKPDNLAYKSYHNFVGIVLKAVRAYEDVPKRKRMITDAMMEWLLTKAAQSPRDSNIRSIVDWIIPDRYAGFRSAEWGQTSLNTYARIEEWPGRPARAATRHDFEFLGDNERHLPDSGLDEGRIRHVVITWRKQKNNMNRQKSVLWRRHSQPCIQRNKSSLLYLQTLSALGHETKRTHGGLSQRQRQSAIHQRHPRQRPASTGRQ